MRGSIYVGRVQSTQHAACVQVLFLNVVYMPSRPMRKGDTTVPTKPAVDTIIPVEYEYQSPKWGLCYLHGRVVCRTRGPGKGAVLVFRIPK